MAKTSILVCNVPNGLTLRLFEWKEGEFGIKMAHETGDRVTLVEGENVVDADLAAQWLEQNAKSDLVTRGMVHLKQ